MLIVDDRGAWWFLENNSNGQRTYIKDETGQPISKTIANLLEGCIRS